MLPPQSREATEVGVRGHHDAAMLDRNGCVLGIGNQLPGGSRFTAQIFEYVQMIGTGTHNARGGALHERGYECEGLVKCGWRVEDAVVGHNTNKARQYEDGEGEWFRSCRQTSDPGRVFVVIGSGFLNVCVDQDVYVGKQHLESPAPTLETDLVVLRVKCPGPVEVDSGTGMNPTNGNQLEGRLLRWLATLQSIVQRSGNEGTHADAAGFGGPAYLPCKPLVKGNRGSHDAFA